MTEEPVLKQSVEGRVGTLILNRPERRNALSPELLIELHVALTRWADSGEVRCVVITGSGDDAFSSGYDLTAIPTEITPETADILKNHNPLELALSTVKNFPYPTIAMWNGYCYGAGLNLSVCCDMRIASDHAKAGMPPARLGIVYHPEGLRQFVEVVGFAVAKELFLTARTFTAAECLQKGLVNRLVPPELLVETTMRLARETAANAPLSLRHTKRILHMLAGSVRLTPEQEKEAEALVAEGFNSDDLKEGQAAFLEKRPPKFTGK
ncbi:MAG: enoyl-CoA hydratase/isomerase family protein [Deltaproteobacteria bacterium]|nr:enoyl-CoA hydratase/isomerase family protein [Deltaproteobacteria bacterium]